MTSSLLRAHGGAGSSRWWRYAIPAALYGLVCAYSLTFHMRAPFKDHWAIVPLIEQLQAGTLSAGDFFQLHGSHWHSSGYLVMLFNARFGTMSLWVEIVISLLAAGAGFLALAAISRQVAVDWKASHRHGLLLACIAFFHFSLDQGLNWVWSWQVAVYISTAGCLWAIALLSKESLSAKSITLAIVSAAAAMYGFATAWSIWPIGLFLLAMCPGASSRRKLVGGTLWASCGFLFALHLRSSQNVEYTARVLPDGSPFHTLTTQFDYAGTYVGAGIVRQIPLATVPVALLGLAALAGSVMALKAPDVGLFTTLQRLRGPLALASYGIGSAVLTGLGRSKLGSSQALAGRYVTFSNYFWLGLVLLILLVGASRVGAIRVGAWSALMAIMLLKLYSLTGVQETIRLTTAANKAACAVAADSSSPDPAQVKLIAAPNQPIERWLMILEDEQLNMFHPAAHRGCLNSATRP